MQNITGTKQYLTFELGDELFALDVSRVRESGGAEDATGEAVIAVKKDCFLSH